MYEFEVNKRNNLIFYGIQSESRETPTMLLSKVRIRKIINIYSFIIYFPLMIKELLYKYVRCITC